MSTRSIVTAWAAALVLVALVVATGGRGTSSPTTAVPRGETVDRSITLGVDAASVERVSVALDDDSVTVERGRWARDAWLIESSLGGVNVSRWIGREAYVASGLRGLATASMLALGDAPDVQDALGVVIDSGGDAVALTVSREAVGGRRPGVFFDADGVPRGVLVNEDLAAALLPDSVRAWAEPAPFFRLGSGPTVVTVTGEDGGVVTLSRRLGRWTVEVEDAETALERDRVRGWLTLLGSLESDGFRKPEEITGRRVTIEARTPMGDGAAVQRLTLAPGSSAGLAEATLDSAESNGGTLSVWMGFDGDAVRSVLEALDALAGRGGGSDAGG